MKCCFYHYLRRGQFSLYGNVSQSGHVLFLLKKHTDLGMVFKIKFYENFMVKFRRNFRSPKHCGMKNRFRSDALPCLNNTKLELELEN